MDKFDRYSRHLILDNFGRPAQENLEKSNIVVIGAGGVGSAALPLLAGSGIGKITIVDGDVVSQSNLHRQTLYTENQIGQSKALMAAKYCQDLNRQIEVVAVNKRIEMQIELKELLKDCDLCLDATDSFESRIQISDCVKTLSKYSIMASAQGYISQMVLFGGNFYLRDFLTDDTLEKEKSSKLPIFAPSAHLSGVWAASYAIEYLAKTRDFEYGKFQSFDISRGIYFNTRF